MAVVGVMARSVSEIEMSDEDLGGSFQVDVSVMEEAIRRLRLLVTSRRERPALHLREVASTAQWVAETPERSAAVLCLAVYGFAIADPEESDWLLASLRRSSIEGG